MCKKLTKICPACLIKFLTDSPINNVVINLSDTFSNNHCTLNEILYSNATLFNFASNNITQEYSHIDTDYQSDSKSIVKQLGSLSRSYCNEFFHKNFEQLSLLFGSSQFNPNNNTLQKINTSNNINNDSNMKLENRTLYDRYIYLNDNTIYHKNNNQLNYIQELIPSIDYLKRNVSSELINKKVSHKNLKFLIGITKSTIKR